MEKLQTIVFLVRHGETDHGYSLDASVDGQRKLTEHGQHQARNVGTYLAQFSPSAMYSSPLIRCQQTAETIIEQLPNKLDIISTEQLVEIYSAAEEIRKEVGERGASIFQTILSRHAGEQIVAVTHQYIIGYIVANFRGVGYQDVDCDFADIYRLVFADKLLVEATHLQPA